MEKDEAIVIESAKPEDAQEICNVFDETWLSTYPNDVAGITFDDIEDRIAKRKSGGAVEKQRKVIEEMPENEALFVARSDKKVVGVCFVIKKEDRNQLQAIYVLPSHQKRGIGMRLWLQVEKFINNSKDTYVEVADYNENAINFYSRLGFIDTGRRMEDERFRMKSGSILKEIEMVKKTNIGFMSIMTYEEYKELQHEVPYKVIVESRGNVLYYFGEAHSFDPNHAQWLEQKKFWQSFLNATEGKKRIAFVEGGKRPALETEAETVTRHGGMGLVAFESAQVGIEVYSPEPSIKDELLMLEKEFSRDEIVYYYFARLVHQWERTMPQPPFESYMQGFLGRANEYLGWPEYDFSMAHMEELHRNFHGTDLNPSDTEFFYNHIDPVHPENSVTNKVANKLSRFRDEHIINEIKKHIDEGYSIFAQYGCSHVVMQEPALKKILN